MKIKKTLLWNFQGTLSWLRLWLQSDNTVKEIRNTYTARALCTLLHQQVFRVTTEAHLQKGHTHEDVDAVFSLCSACLRSAHDVQTPRDIQRRIKEKVGPVFQSKGMQFSIDLVGEVPRSIFQETLWTNLGWSFGLWWFVYVCVDDFFCETEVRQWTDFLPQNVTFKNAYRVRKLQDDDEMQVPVPHHFTFMPRSGLLFLSLNCFNMF